MPAMTSSFRVPDGRMMWTLQISLSSASFWPLSVSRVYLGIIFAAARTTSACGSPCGAGWDCWSACGAGTSHVQFVLRTFWYVRCPSPSTPQCTDATSLWDLLTAALQQPVGSEHESARQSTPRWFAETEAVISLPVPAVSDTSPMFPNAASAK